MAKPKMKPLGDKVIVKRLEANDVTAGGIFLPESAKEKPKRGIIQAVGPGRVTDTGERAPAPPQIITAGSNDPKCVN